MNSELTEAFRNNAAFRDLLHAVKAWEGCCPVNPGKENHPAVLLAVQHGVLRIGNERLGPLGVSTGQKCLTLTTAGWDLVGRPGVNPEDVMTKENCLYDTNGDGDCHYCYRRGGCRKIGGPFPRGATIAQRLGIPWPTITESAPTESPASESYWRRLFSTLKR